MTTYRQGTVTRILEEHAGLQRLEVSSVAAGETHHERAYVLTELVPPCAVGDRVVMNTTAVDLGLGTGGWHVVHWNLSVEEWSNPGPDHVMKLRYTSLQCDVGTSELDSPLVNDLGRTPVIVCSLHSQVAATAIALGARWPACRVGYVMTDGAALPLALSDLVRQLRARDMLSLTVTAGNAFGGEMEAVTIASALGLAVGSGLVDAVIVGMGPGVVGTGTQLGTTAIEVAAIVDTVESLGGCPILCVRGSDGDRRDRHRGISHHTRTAIALTHARPLVGVPSDRAGELDDPRVELVEVSQPDARELFGSHPIRVTSMGRDVHADPAFFEWAAAAAEVAGRLQCRAMSDGG